MRRTRLKPLWSLRVRQRTLADEAISKPLILSLILHLALGPSPAGACPELGRRALREPNTLESSQRSGLEEALQTPLSKSPAAGPSTESLRTGLEERYVNWITPPEVPYTFKALVMRLLREDEEIQRILRESLSPERQLYLILSDSWFGAGPVESTERTNWARSSDPNIRRLAHIRGEGYLWFIPSRTLSSSEGQVQRMLRKQAGVVLVYARGAMTPDQRLGLTLQKEFYGKRAGFLYQALVGDLMMSVLMEEGFLEIATAVFERIFDPPMTVVGNRFLEEPIIWQYVWDYLGGVRGYRQHLGEQVSADFQRFEQHYEWLRLGRTQREAIHSFLHRPRGGSFPKEPALVGAV